MLKEIQIILPLLAPLCGFPRTAGEKIQHKHVRACFPWEEGGEEKKKAAAHTAPSWEACLVSLLLSPITLVWLERSLPSANYFQTQLGSGTGPRRESMRRLARLRFWLKPHCAFLSQSQHHWAYYLHGPLSNQQGLKERMSFMIETLSVWTRRF